MLRTTVKRALRRFDGITHEAELGRQHHFIAAAANCPSDQFLVEVRAVHVGGIKEIEALLQCVMDGRDRFRVIVRTVKLTHAHATEPDGGNLRTIATDLAHLHFSIPVGYRRRWTIRVVPPERFIAG